MLWKINKWNLFQSKECGPFHGACSCPLAYLTDLAVAWLASCAKPVAHNLHSKTLTWGSGVKHSKQLHESGRVLSKTSTRTEPYYIERITGRVNHRLDVWATPLLHCARKKKKWNVELSINIKAHSLLLHNITSTPRRHPINSRAQGQAEMCF